MTIRSVDVFGTLIERIFDEHYAARAGALRTVAMARARGLVPPADPVAFRLLVERDLRRDRAQIGAPTEFPNRIIIAEMLRRLGAGAWAEDTGDEIAAWELQQEILATRPRASILDRVRAWHRAGARIIAVSDTHYTADELAKLFRHHGITEISAIYASADYGCSKFAGTLYDVVLSAENVKPAELCHIGDNVVSDIISAAERGPAVRWIRRPAAPPALPKAPQVDGRSPAFDLGYRVLGPVLVGFVRLVFEQARRDDISRLLFVARDGYLPLQIASIIKPEGAADLFYIHLSRRAIVPASSDFLALGDVPEAVDRIVANVRSLQGDPNLIIRLQKYFGVPDPVMLAETKRLNLAVGDEAELRRLLADPIALAVLKQATEGSRDLLYRYLDQEAGLSRHAALVDIGWRGTIHHALAEIAGRRSLEVPSAYYLGLWDNGTRSRQPDNAVGLIGDERRGRNLWEGSGFHNFSLLEAVCRAGHGMVTGFSEDADGTVLPIHLEQGRARDAERSSEATKAEIQSGVLEYARWFAGAIPELLPEPKAVRGEAQSMLFRLAFFPTRAEQEIGRVLVHSEATDEHWAQPLIMSRGHGINGWFAGVRSTWKGGYFRATLGLAGAAAYCVLEAVLSYLTLDQKLALRRLLFGKRA